MSSSRLFSDKICCSDSFNSLPMSQRLLYYQLNFETDTIGEVAGAARIARGYGFTESDLQALIDAGYVIEVEGRHFIRHFFIHNRLPNGGMKTSAENLFCDTPLTFQFEGEEYKSAYCLIDADSPNVSQKLETNTIQSNASQHEENSKTTKLNKKEEKITVRCPECGGECAFVVDHDTGIYHAECTEHSEFFLDPNTGKVIDPMSALCR